VQDKVGTLPASLSLMSMAITFRFYILPQNSSKHNTLCYINTYCRGLDELQTCSDGSGQEDETRDQAWLDRLVQIRYKKIKKGRRGRRERKTVKYKEEISEPKIALLLLLLLV
jgi:hypothetical protein